MDKCLPQPLLCFMASCPSSHLPSLEMIENSFSFSYDRSQPPGEFGLRDMIPMKLPYAHDLEVFKLRLCC